MKPFPFSYLLNPSMEEVTIYGQSHIATADAVYETDITGGTHYSINAVSHTPNMPERDDLWQAVVQSGDHPATILSMGLPSCISEEERQLHTLLH